MGYDDDCELLEEYGRLRFPVRREQRVGVVREMLDAKAGLVDVAVRFKVRAAISNGTSGSCQANGSRV